MRKQFLNRQSTPGTGGTAWCPQAAVPALPLRGQCRQRRASQRVKTLHPLFLLRGLGTLPLVRAPAHLLCAALTGPAPPPPPSRISFMGWVLLFCACPRLSAHLQPPPQPYRSLHLLRLEVPRLERLLPPHIAQPPAKQKNVPQGDPLPGGLHLQQSASPPPWVRAHFLFVSGGHLLSLALFIFLSILVLL